MNASVQEVALSAATASDAAGQTRERALSGAGIVEKAVQSIGHDAVDVLRMFPKLRHIVLGCQRNMGASSS